MVSNELVTVTTAAIFSFALVWTLWICFFSPMKPLFNMKSSGLMKLFSYCSLKCCSGKKRIGIRKSINILLRKDFTVALTYSMSHSPSMPTFVCCLALLFHALDGEYLGFTVFSMFCLFAANYFSSWVAWEQKKFSFHYPLFQMKGRLSYWVWSAYDSKMLLSGNLLMLSGVHVLLSVF